MSDDAVRKIGEVAEITGLSIRTLRHYDELGLVVPSGHTAGGFRLYTDADVQRLLVIRRMKPLGFSLAEMKRLLDALDVLRGEPGTTGSGDAQRERSRAVLTQCWEQTRDSAARLRRHLAYADELTELLAGAGGR